MKRSGMTKIRMMVIALLTAGCMQMFPHAVFAESHTFPGIRDEAFPPFKGEGPLVEGAAKTGGMIVGSTAGVVAGFPLGMVGALAGAPFNLHREGAYAGFITPTVMGQAVGQYTVGTVTWLPKKIFYDAPKAFFDVISSEDQKHIK